MSNFYVCQKCGEDFTPTGDERHHIIAGEGAWVLDLAEHYPPCGGLGVDRFPDLVKPAGHEPFTARYLIPGALYATYRDRGTLDGGEVIGLHFTPAEGDAGYFGLGPTPGTARFWTAVQRALEDIGEQPKGPDNPHTIHRVPIEWAEDGPPRLD